MKLYANSSGEILQVQLENYPNNLFYGSTPPGTSLFEFDDVTNVQLNQDILTLPLGHFRIINGVLHKDGVAIVIVPPRDEFTAIQKILTEYPNMPAWVKDLTAAEAETYITNQIWSGYTIAQVNIWIDANVTGTTIATALANIRAALKIIAAAIITMRGLFVITAKLLIYIRDLTIRFRKSI